MTKETSDQPSREGIHNAPQRTGTCELDQLPVKVLEMILTILRKRETPQ